MVIVVSRHGAEAGNQNEQGQHHRWHRTDTHVSTTLFFNAIHCPQVDEGICPEAKTFVGKSR
jgi:hypothetical protein